eukprot:SAG25_NODE_2475_length_1582_cov_7.422117_2_plen_244_part_01
MVSKSLTSMDLSKCGISVAGVTEVAKFISAGAAVNSLTLSGNPLTGATRDGYGDWINIDSDMSGFVALCAVLGKLTKVNLSGCHLGPTSTGELAKVFSDARAVLTSLNMSGNCPVGRISRDNDGRRPWLPGNEFEAWTTVCDAVQSSQVTEWNISECYLGPDAMTILSTRLSAVLAHLAICQNKIGSEGGTALVEAIKTSNLVSISIGKDLTLPIKGELDVPTLDASKQDIDPGYVMILAWWLT